MKIRVERFCLLATSVDWQTWLYNYNKDLYSQFIARLRQASGCGENRQIMKETLAVIDQSGGGDELADFLRIYHSHMIIDDTVAVSADESELDKLFGTGILTYPKRQIIRDDPARLLSTVRQFASDKINCEFLIADGKAYVEYLDKGEEKLLLTIPAKNWLLRAKTNGKT